MITLKNIVQNRENDDTLIDKTAYIINDIHVSIQNKTLTINQIVDELSIDLNMVNSHLIKRFIDEGFISINDLFYIVKDEKIVNHILGDIDWVGQQSYYGRELKELCSNETNEVFFWGTAYCGKSTLIGMLLSYLNTQYDIVPNIDCQGVENLTLYSNMYKADRISYFCSGNVSTSFEEMAFMLIKDKEKIPYTFIETPEILSRAIYRSYANESLSEGESIMLNNLTSICNHTYLKRIHVICLPNDNIKIGWDGSARNAFMMPLIQFLISNKIISHKDSVLLLSTKESPSVTSQEAQKHIKEGYTGFYNSIVVESKKQLFDLQVLPFSVGKVYFQDICSPDFTLTKEIIDHIINRSKLLHQSIYKRILNLFK